MQLYVNESERGFRSLPMVQAGISVSTESTYIRTQVLQILEISWVRRPLSDMPEHVRGPGLAVGEEKVKEGPVIKWTPATMAVRSVVRQLSNCCRGGSSRRLDVEEGRRM
jgi:hypothetical protein